MALGEEIRRLSALVDTFMAPFHPDALVLGVYKRELHAHVEAGLGSNLRSRLSDAVANNMESSQKEMTGRPEVVADGRTRRGGQMLFKLCRGWLG